MAKVEFRRSPVDGKYRVYKQVEVHGILGEPPYSSNNDNIQHMWVPVSVCDTADEAKTELQRIKRNAKR